MRALLPWLYPYNTLWLVISECGFDCSQTIQFIPHIHSLRRIIAIMWSNLGVKGYDLYRLRLGGGGSYLAREALGIMRPLLGKFSRTGVENRQRKWYSFNMVIGITIIVVALVTTLNKGYLTSLSLGVAIIQMVALSGFTALIVTLIAGRFRKN